MSFNAGSLLWDAPPTRTLSDWIERAKSCIVDFDVEETKRRYAFQPYARMREDNGTNNASIHNFPFAARRSLSRSVDNSDHSEPSDNNADLILRDGSCRATIADYKAHYRLNIGLYCQEFAIDDTAIDLLVRFVNSFPDVFNLGLSWGGVNGYTVKGIQPGRLTCTDGFWNQRYAGASWNYALYPGEQLTEQLLHESSDRPMQ